MITLMDVYTPSGLHAGAAEYLYELLLQRPKEANISHRDPPKYVEHLLFVKHRPYWRWWILVNERTWVGALSVTDRNEIGIAIDEKHRRKGYAREAIAVLRANVEPLPAKPGYRPGTFLANVSPENTASHHLFREAGGKVIQVTYRL